MNGPTPLRDPEWLDCTPRENVMYVTGLITGFAFGLLLWAVFG